MAASSVFDILESGEHALPILGNGLVEKPLARSSNASAGRAGVEERVPAREAPIVFTCFALSNK